MSSPKIKLHYETKLSCPAEILWQQISIKELCGHWINQVFPGSVIEGNWISLGEDIRFIDKNRDGTLVRLSSYELNSELTFEHIASIEKGQTIIDSKNETSWTGTSEKYSIEDHGESCLFKVDIATSNVNKTMFEETMPEALDYIKKQCEEVINGLKYPIGTFENKESFSSKEIKRFIDVISALPSETKRLAADLTRQEMEYCYRPNGWNIAQVVHHLSDSHMNAIIRFKLALTEDNPTIKPYKEDRWAKLKDSNSLDLSLSLNILESMHEKWRILLMSLDKKDFSRTYFHPESNKKVTLAQTAGMYAWHSEHHLAHINQALSYKFN
jgi:hypothetical protein